MPLIIPRWQDADPRVLRGQVVAVIDVLRWSTVVVTALANGAEAVEAYAEPVDALARAGVLGRGRAILGGERGNVALPGFDVGNSPAEYTRERVAGRVVVTTTTNGTQALLTAREAREVIVAAFVNLDAVVRHLRAASEAGRSITLLCAGQAGIEAAEDTACAEALAAGVHELQRDAAHGGPHGAGIGERAGRAQRSSRSDAAAAMRAQRASESVARTTSEPDRSHYRERATNAPHAMALRAAGFAADVDAALRLSVYDVVPVTIAGVIRPKVG